MASWAIHNGSTNNKGKLTLQGDELTSGENTFILKSGTNNSNGQTLATSIITPISLRNINIISDDKIVKGEKLPVTAKINADVSDLSGYTINLSGAITGNYITDRYGQITAYYEGKGEGSKSVVATAGNWSSTLSFEDYIEYWDTSTYYEEHYGQNQGFDKFTKYYGLNTETNNLGYVCIGDYEELEGWELNFKISSPISNIYFDIFGWIGTPPTMYDMVLDRKVSFSANDEINARLVDGTLTVTKNNNSFFTKQLNNNSFPAIMLKNDTSSVVVSSSSPYAQSNPTLKFNELTFKGV